MATNIQLAGRVSRHAQLTTVVLRKADVDARFDVDDPPGELKVDLKYRAEHAGELADVLRERDVKIVVDFKFSMGLDVDGEQTDALAIDASFLLKYEFGERAEFDEICLKHFAEVNGPYNAWPYWRELVQSVIGRVGLGSFTLPVFHPQPQEVPEPTERETTPAGT